MVQYDTLREFIAHVEDRGEVKKINGAHWDLELACINELVAETNGPLLLFDKIGECAPGFRVATGVLTNFNRTCLALGLPLETKPMKVIEHWKNTLRDIKPIAPKFFDDAPIKQNIERGSDINILKFPTPQWHPKDGGRYIGTGGLIVIQDPTDKWVNCAINRCMVVSKNQVALQIGNAGQNATIIKKYHQENKPCPVAICMSPDPIMMLAGGMKVPWGVSEYEFAGGIRQRPVPLTKGVETNLPIPFNPEIVFEGIIEPGATCDEGPFGEWTGYIAGTYSKESGFPFLVTVTSVMYCNDPILLGVRPLKPPAPWYTAVPITNASTIWGQLEAGGQRGIKGVWTHVLESFGAVWTVVSIQQLYKGHSKEVGIATTVCPGSDGWGAFVVVVDDDIDITNLNEVMWTLSMRCDLSKSVMTIDGIRSSSLYPWLTKTGGSGSYVGSRIIFDACKDYDRRATYPPVNRFDDKYRDEILKTWGNKIFSSGEK